MTNITMTETCPNCGEPTSEPRITTTDKEVENMLKETNLTVSPLCKTCKVEKLTNDFFERNCQLVEKAGDNQLVIVIWPDIEDLVETVVRIMK